MDLISRQEVIDALCDNCDHVEAVCPHYPCKQYIVIENLPSAQAEVRTEMSSADTIIRQAAIDALYTEIIKRRLMDDVNDGMLDEFDTESILKKLPSAQPETNCSEIPNNWIPCSERLPEDEYVLISKKPTKLSGSKWCVTIAIRMADPRSRKVDWRDIGFNVIQDNEVLAWMPLPEPARLENDQWEK